MASIHCPVCNTAFPENATSCPCCGLLPQTFSPPNPPEESPSTQANSIIAAGSGLLARFLPNETTGLTLWNGVLGAALALPGVRVDRTDFLRRNLGTYVASDLVAKAIETTPARAGVPATVIENAANSSMKWHRAGVTATSAIAGLPGGWWIAGTIPADLAQYFYHNVVILQKLAYLHGWPPLLTEDEDIDDETKLVFTLFIGVMLGAEGAAIGVGKLANALAVEVAKRVPRAPLTQYALYQISKDVAKWIGIKLTKAKAGEFLGRAIPLLGGAIGGTITWFAFGNSVKRLRMHLAGLPLAADGSEPSCNELNAQTTSAEDPANL